LSQKKEEVDEVMEKWSILIDRIKQLVAQKGKKLVVINIDARPDPEEQYNMYMATVEMMKSQYETVVTTGLPGEERISWPYHDVQFYIREGVEKIHSTGNYEVIQQIFNAV
jgi:hypothetical protein